MTDIVSGGAVSWMNEKLLKIHRQGIQKGTVTAIFLAIVGLISGCATTPDGERNVDPFETVNRDIYQFNRDFDRAFLKPVADAYVEVTPQIIRTSVSNFFDNIGYLNVILNDFLQGKARQGFWDTSRFVLNSTVGLAGLFDVATAMGLEEHDEDFGQTLGVWGAGSGPYLMLPILGPSTVRDAPGIPVTAVTSPLFYVDQVAVTAPVGALGAVDARARAIGAFRFIEEAALDPYVFTREAYLQRRTFLIYDGNPPRPKFFDEFDEEFEE